MPCLSALLFDPDLQVNLLFEGPITLSRLGTLITISRFPALQFVQFEISILKHYQNLSIHGYLVTYNIRLHSFAKRAIIKGVGKLCAYLDIKACVGWVGE